MKYHNIPTLFDNQASLINGKNIGTDSVRYIQDAGQKTAGNTYIDKNTNELYVCVTTTNSVNNDGNFSKFNLKEAFNKLDNLTTNSGRKNITYKILGKKLIEREWYEHTSTYFFHYDNIMTVEKFDPKEFEYLLFYIDENAANLSNSSSGGLNIVNGWFQPSEMGVLMLPAGIGIYTKYDKVPVGKYSFTNNSINPEFFCQYFVKTDGIALHITVPKDLALPSNIKYTAGFMVVGISIVRY